MDEMTKTKPKKKEYLMSLDNIIYYHNQLKRRQEKLYSDTEKLDEIWNKTKNPYLFTKELEKRGCCCCYKCIKKETDKKN